MSELAIPPQPSVDAAASMVSMLRQRGVLDATGADFSALFRDAEDVDAAYDRFVEIGRFLSVTYDSARWWISDWLLFGEGMLGDRFHQAVEILGLSEPTILDYIRVGMRVSRSRRRDDLTYSHHRAVAKLEPDAQTYYLERAAEEHLSTRELGDAIATDKAKQDEDDDGRHETVEVIRIRVDRSILAAVVHAAQPLGDGRYAVPEEAIVRLRGAIGEGD